MRRCTAAILLGVLTTLAAAWGLAALVPVPMYPRRVVRAWLGTDGRAWSTAEVHLPGVVDSWWDDLADSYAGTPEEILAANRATMERLVAERRGTDQHMRLAEGPPGWGSLRGGRAGPASGLGSDTAYGLPLPCLWYSVRSGTQQGQRDRAGQRADRRWLPARGRALGAGQGLSGASVPADLDRGRARFDLLVMRLVGAPGDVGRREAPASYPSRPLRRLRL
ncbi:MAG: hypothetical protein IPJ41_03115 [Phycisphaerales bacterium]|nr:hypothetical protein [Phycisphaerales bacterium]